MNDTRKLRAAKQMRRDVRRTRKRRHTKADDDILVTTVRKTLAKHPAALLGIASCFISWAVPEPGTRVKGGPRESKALEEFVNGLAGRRLRETTALLAAFAEMLVEDERLRERCRSEVATRHDQLPRWLTGLPRVEVLRVLRRTELLGDGDELLIGLRFADASELTVVAFVDHNELSGVTEIGVIRQPLDRVLARPIQRAEPEPRFEEMEPADARTRLEYGLRFGALLSRSDECRLAQPFLRWVITLLPEGGHPYMGPSNAASELLDGFFASPAGAPFVDVDYRAFLDQLCETGCGDPSRWSVRRISDILRDPFPDDGVPLEIALDAPTLLRAFIAFAHADSGIRQELTDDAIAVIDEMSLDYKRRLVAEATKKGGDYS
ncbi:hypothetical protein [Mycolicibacterium sp.]|uniref:hypothetical protein n=1 Tax=Mycolicibacterium sp. TaxID=2320850 RepID=UPI001A261365|nr:hypothetical protein [Mycolicibacterium sp.]MBJ7341835.1 hypothetical protein [Mycolicibacterium sp.]